MRGPERRPNPPLATKKNPKGFFFVARIYKNLRHYGVVERAHEVRWTSAMRGPERRPNPPLATKKNPKGFFFVALFLLLLVFKIPG